MAVEVRLQTTDPSLNDQEREIANFGINGDDMTTTGCIVLTSTIRNAYGLQNYDTTTNFLKTHTNNGQGRTSLTHIIYFGLALVQGATECIVTMKGSEFQWSGIVNIQKSFALPISPAPPFPWAPPVPPSPPPAPPVFQFTLLTPLPNDLLPPWYPEPSIADRALCTPVAHAMQLQHLHLVGVVPEVPAGAPYSVGFSATGAFTTTATVLPAHVSQFYSICPRPPSEQPGFSWFMNTNDRGALSVNGPGTYGFTRGTLLGSAVVGATEFYARTPAAGLTGYAYHVSGAASVSGRVPFGAPAKQGRVWNGLRLHRRQSAVVLYLDGWTLSSLAFTTIDQVASSPWACGLR